MLRLMRRSTLGRVMAEGLKTRRARRTSGLFSQAMYRDKAHPSEAPKRLKWFSCPS